MWPWGHLAFAYITYRGWGLLQGRRSLAGLAVVFLAVGAMAPDLIDKPLAWTVPLLPSGRSLAHSFLTVGVVGVVLHFVVTDPGPRKLAGAFYFGAVSHLIADAVPGLLAGDLEAVFFWNWPFGPHPEYTLDSSFVAHFAQLEVQLQQLANGEFGAVGWVGIELVFVAVVVVVWLFDGLPGLWVVGRKLRGVLERYGR